MYINATQAAIDAARNSYDRLIKFSRFDERITSQDIRDSFDAMHALENTITVAEYSDSYFDNDGNFIINLRDELSDIRISIENREAILLAQNFVEALECASRLNQLAFR